MYITLYGVSCLSCHSKLTQGELKVPVISLARLGENILCQAEQCTSAVNLPWHLSPVNPSRHMHSNIFPPCPGLHVPPFSHGLGRQGSPATKKMFCDNKRVGNKMNKEIAYNVMKPLVIKESTILNERNGTRQIKRKK